MTPILTRALILAGGAVLALAWIGPLPALAAHTFSAHMALHMSVVALAAPLLAAGFSGMRWPMGSGPLPLAVPLMAALLEFVIVWGWHMPALHAAARTSTALFTLEQGSFLLAGLLLWMTCLGRREDPAGALVGTVSLLLTSMHMTLLGALLSFAQRPLYAHAHGADPTARLADQQLGGVIMLLAGGLVYLAGGLSLMARVVAPSPLPHREARR